jgi:hypothetical protein
MNEYRIKARIDNELKFESHKKACQGLFWAVHHKCIFLKSL